MCLSGRRPRSITFCEEFAPAAADLVLLPNSPLVAVD